MEYKQNASENCMTNSMVVKLYEFQIVICTEVFMYVCIYSLLQILL